MGRLRSLLIPGIVGAALAVPAVSPAGKGACTLGEPQQVQSGLGKRLYSMALGVGPASAILGWSVATDAVQLLPLHQDGKSSGEVRVLPVAGARGLYELRPAAEQRFLLRTHHLCAPAIRDHKCLVGQLVDATGQGVGESARIDTNEWITRGQTQRFSEGLLTLFRTTYKSPRLVRFQWSGNTLAASEEKAYATCYQTGGIEVETAEGIDDDGGLLQVLDNKWVVLHGGRAGGGSPKAGFLCSADGRKVISAMIATSKFRAVKQDSDGLKVLYDEYAEGDDSDTPTGTFQATLTLSGKLSGAKSVGKGKPLPALPALFESGEPKAQIDAGPDGKAAPRALLYDRKGQQLGANLSLAKGHKGPKDVPTYLIAWTGDHFLYAYSSFERDSWAIYTTSIRCE